RSQHLAELFADPAGQTARRMAELLDLGSEGTATALAHMGRHQRCHASGRREGKAVPFDRRIVLGITLVEQIAVFDEQEAVDDQWWDRGKALEGPLRELGAIEP